MSRRKSRILAFQALYSWDVSKSSVDDLPPFYFNPERMPKCSIDSILQKDSEIEAGMEMKEPSDSLKEEQTFASFIISGTIDHIDEIDKVIEVVNSYGK